MPLKVLYCTAVYGNIHIYTNISTIFCQLILYFPASHLLVKTFTSFSLHLSKSYLLSIKILGVLGSNGGRQHIRVTWGFCGFFGFFFPKLTFSLFALAPIHVISSFSNTYLSVGVSNVSYMLTHHIFILYIKLWLILFHFHVIYIINQIINSLRAGSACGTL